VKPLLLDATQTALRAELARMIEGKPELTSLTEINLMKLGRELRMQKIVFETARDVYDQMKPTWKGSREFLLAQVVGIVERFVASDRIHISPPFFAQDDLRRRIVITLNMTKLVQHIWEAIRFENTEAIVPVFDDEHPVRSTATCGRDSRGGRASVPTDPTSIFVFMTVLGKRPNHASWTLTQRWLPGLKTSISDSKLSTSLRASCASTGRIFWSG